MQKLLLVLGLGFLALLTLSADRVQAQGVEHAQLLLEDLVGVALYPDGTTPVEKLPVRLYDVEREKVIYKTSTDENGQFRIPSVRTGKVYVFIGRVRVDLTLLKKAEAVFNQQHTIVVVMNRHMLYGRHPAPQDLLPFLNVWLLSEVFDEPPEEPTPMSP